MPPAVEWAADQGRVMFFLIWQGAGPLDAGIVSDRAVSELWDYFLYEMVLNERGLVNAEVWHHKHRQEAGTTPWLLT